VPSDGRGNLGWKWSDVEEIGIALYEKYPDVKPLGVRFTDLLTWIGELDEFDDDLKTSNEKKLESVQMAWYEEWKLDHEDEDELD
jgi:FeS assembly protein IscX